MSTPLTASGSQETASSMDIAEIQEINDAHIGELVPLTASQTATLRREFAPALVLLKSLNQILTQGDLPAEHGPPPDAHQSLDKKLQTFVNKVAQICDSRPKGHTVTACVVLKQENGRVLYLFASNNRKTKDLRKMAAFVRSVFDVLKANISVGSAKKQSDALLNDRLLRMVLAFNQDRVRGYRSALGDNLRKCLQRCAAPGDEDNAVIAKSLEPLLQLIPERGQESQDFAEKVSRLILAILRQQKTPAWRLIERQTLARQNDRGNCWAMTQHAAGRLVSYRYAAETLTMAHHIWAPTSLFLEYDIGFLHSSKEGDDPLVNYNNKSGLEKFEPLPADKIINRMTADSPKQERLKALAESLQMTATAATETTDESETRKLDAIIATQWQSDMASRVHAEMLLLDYLQRTPGRTMPHRFFGGLRYIGTSKPTCRLCRYYFDARAPDVATRPTHNNVYYRWRLPDTYRLSGDPRPAGQTAANKPGVNKPGAKKSGARKSGVKPGVSKVGVEPAIAPGATNGETQENGQHVHHAQNARNGQNGQTGQYSQNENTKEKTKRKSPKSLPPPSGSGGIPCSRSRRR